MISAIPEPRHGRIRRVINTVVAAHRTMQNEPFIRERARELVAHARSSARRRAPSIWSRRSTRSPRS